MATNQRLSSLTEYKTILPYASEIFGVYQPLIGWKGKRNMNRFITKPILLPYVVIEQNTDLIVREQKIDHKSIRFNEYLKINHDPRAGKLPDELQFYESIQIHSPQIEKNNSNILLQLLKGEIKDESDIEKKLESESFKKLVGMASEILYSDYKKTL